MNNNAYKNLMEDRLRELAEHFNNTTGGLSEQETKLALKETRELWNDLTSGMWNDWQGFNRNVTEDFLLDVLHELEEANNMTPVWLGQVMTEELARKVNWLANNLGGE